MIVKCVHLTLGEALPPDACDWPGRRDPRQRVKDGERVFGEGDTVGLPKLAGRKVQDSRPGRILHVPARVPAQTSFPRRAAEVAVTGTLGGCVAEDVEHLPPLGD